jgi:asparagine synthase (glutamine-hydrolysing)
MIDQYKLNDKELLLQSDLAGEYPIYIYLSDNRDCLLYSTCIKHLLNDSRVIKPLKVTTEGISFLLQSGVVPSPKTVFKNIYFLGIGDKVSIQTMNNQIELSFSNTFPFLNEYRDKEAIVDEDYILQILAEATISRLDSSKPAYLFHSAGKDSNCIALALAEAGYQDKVTCISHQSKGDKDESEISKQIAQKLGFKHQKLYEPKVIEQQHIESINNYFKNIPLPCMDNVALAYPLYMTQIDLKNTNIIDGLGNDVYIGHIPGKTEYKRQNYFSRFHRLKPITGKLTSGTVFDIISATRSEWTGLYGLTFGDTLKILNNSFNVYSYWKYMDFSRRNLDYFDFRASLKGTMLEQGIFTRKIRNFSDVIDSNIILPWTNHKVAEYFSKLPEKYLFDRKTFKNKLILRKILKERIGLDSDQLGKMAYEFDFFSLIMMMKENVDNEILSCKLWNKKGVEKLLNYFYNNIDSRKRITNIIQRIYLISAWYNHNRYVKK